MSQADMAFIYSVQLKSRQGKKEIVDTGRFASILFLNYQQLRFLQGQLFFFFFFSYFIYIITLTIYFFVTNAYKEGYELFLKMPKRKASKFIIIFSIIYVFLYLTNFIRPPVPFLNYGVQGTSFSLFVQWSELDQMIVLDFTLIGVGFWMELKGPNSSFLLNGAFSSNLQNPRTFFFFF